MKVIVVGARVLTSIPTTLQLTTSFLDETPSAGLQTERTAVVEQWIGIHEITSASADGDGSSGGPESPDGSRG